MDFYLPGFHAGLDNTSIPQDHPTRGGEQVREVRVFHAVTPALTQTTNYFFSLGGRMTEAELDIMHGYLRSVVEEDIFATVEIETLLTRLGHEPAELMLKSDTTAVQARRALQAMMEREQARPVPVTP
jgi:vanillate O-demethylase monooxygenase subunit